jgi:hypothetical protein
LETTGLNTNLKNKPIVANLLISQESRNTVKSLQYLCFGKHRLAHTIYSRDSSVSFATGYVLGGRGSIPAKPRDLSLHDRVQTQPLTEWAPRALSQGVKWPACEAKDSPPSSADVKSCGAIRPFFDTSSWPGA